MAKCDLCVLLMASGLSGVSMAQQPFPTYADNGTWNVLSCIYGIGVWCGTQSIAYAGSDSVCGEVWSTYSWPSWGMDPGIAYVRNEGQRTLLRRTTNCADKQYVLYDFGMEAGDSVYAPMNMDLMEQDTTLFILQDIDTVEILGVERRRFSLLFDRCNETLVNTPMQWIEGIGSTMHPLYPVDCLCDFCERSLTLLCYDSSGVQLYVDPVYQTCDTLITAIDERTGGHVDGLHVTNDTGGGALIVSVGQCVLERRRSALSIVLLSSDGRLIRQQRVQAEASSGIRMDVRSVTAGAYVLLLTDGAGRLAGQRVVIP